MILIWSSFLILFLVIFNKIIYFCLGGGGFGGRGGGGRGGGGRGGKLTFHTGATQTNIQVVKLTIIKPKTKNQVYFFKNH